MSLKARGFAGLPRRRGALAPQAGHSLILTVVAISFFGTAVLLFVMDIMTTGRQRLKQPGALRVAAAKLEEVRDPKNGWFPYQRDPVYGFEDDEQNWILEADNPNALTPSERPDLNLSPEGEDGAEPPARASAREALAATSLPVAHAEKKLRRTNDRASEGRSALAVPVHFPETAAVFRLNNLPNDPNRMAGVRFIAYDVFIPADCPGFVGCLFFMKDKDGLWYQARSQAALLPGRWTTVTADLRGGSPDVTPLGHVGQWDDNQASQIKTIGITFYGDKKYDGQVLLDNFRGWQRPQRFAATITPLVAPSAEKMEELKEMKARAAAFKEAPLQVLNFRTEPPAPPTGPGEGHSPPVVRKFDTLTLRFELNRQPENPFDPEKADITCSVETPSRARLEHIGFWYQDYDRADRFSGDELRPIGRPEWRVRITPREEGEYSYSLRIKLKEETITTPAKTFVCIPSNEKGFVRVSTHDPRFFEYENGDFFYPVGHNLHSPVDIRCWKELLHQEPPAGRGLKMYAEFFDKMQQSGENTAEVWMASWWLGIEWSSKWRDYYGPGRYSLQHAWKLDALLEMARQHGLRIHLVLDNHGKFSSYCDWEWDLNPYNVKGDPGGVVTLAKDFFTDPTCQKWHRNKLRYIAARWGADPTVMGWELVSEFDLVGGTNRNIMQRREYHQSPETREWAGKMIPWLRQCDIYHHPITNHYASDFTWVDTALARTPLLDYVTTDAYRPPEPYTMQAVRMQRWFTAQFGPENAKPFWVTEYGGDFNGVQQISQMAADVHAGPWASWMTDAGGTPLIWWYDYIDRNNLYSQYRAFANFIQGEDRRGIKGVMGPLAKTGMSRGELSSYAYRWPTGAYAWVYDNNSMSALPDIADQPRHEGVEDYVSGLQPGKYRVEFWDCDQGKVLRSEVKDLRLGALLPLKFPEFSNDIAVKVRVEK